MQSQPTPRPVRRRLRISRVLALLAVLGGLAVAGLVAKTLAGMPVLAAMPAPTAGRSMIYDSAGHAVTAVGGGLNLQPVDIAAVPANVQHAFVAVEDRRFYQNGGFDLRGLLRAAWADVRGRPLQGGSTITEQLAKNLYLTPADTLSRKLKEFWLGLQLARTYSKAQIMQEYLNIIYLGDGTYGVQAAAKDYFGKPVAQLDVAQGALLAGLTQAPSAYDPRVHPDAALARRNTVIQLMAQQGYITAAQAKQAGSEPLGLAAARPTSDSSAYPDPWFVDAVISQLENVDHLTPQEVVGGGLRIDTTLNPAVQADADKAVAALASDGPAFSLRAKDVLQAAEVVLDPATGDVLAIVGGRTHPTAMAYDRATQAERQPGSAIKPLAVYTPALLSGMTPGTVVDDAVQTYAGGYTPTNYDNLYYGLTTLTEALRRSVNTVAVKVLNRVGVADGMKTAEAMGLPLTAKDAHLALALGGTYDCCTPLAMADAYATLANGGVHVNARLITQVTAPDGRVLVKNPVRSRRAIPANVAYVMTKMLEAVDEAQPNQGWDVLSGPLDSNWGTGYDASVQDNVPGWPTAAKTGTTNSNQDAWYLAYTPKLVAAVWLGYDQPRPFAGLYGGEFAGPVARDTLKAALAGQTPVHFPQPAGVVQAPIDIKAAPWTVQLPGSLTPSQDVRNEWFVAGTQPTARSSSWTSCGSGGGISLQRTDQGQAWAMGMAAAVHTADWQALIPADMSLVSCGPLVAAAPASTVAATASATPSATAAATASGSPVVLAANTPAPGCAPAGAGEACTLVLADGQAIQPAMLTATSGQSIALTVVAASGVHRLVIPALNVDEAVTPSSPVQLTVRAPKPGSYPIVDLSAKGASASVLVVSQ